MARYLLGIQQKFVHLSQVAIRPTLINGQPGLIGYLGEDLDEKYLLSLGREGKEKIKQKVAWYKRAIEKGEAAFAMVLAYTSNQIQEIDIIINPEKLRHIPALNVDDNFCC